MTFLDVGIGDADLLIATIDSLNGVGAIVTVKEEIKGSEARGDTLHASFSMPRGCSVSQIPLMSCGNPVKRILLEISKDIQLSEKITEKYLIPDFSIQYIQLRSMLFFRENYQEPSISGVFSL